jgi:ABC-type thiamine transport system ATPase subunit
MQTEPALTIGLITAFITAVITLVVAFGVTITQEQAAAILGVVGAGGSLLQALWTRRRVTPVAGKQG